MRRPVTYTVSTPEDSTLGITLVATHGESNPLTYPIINASVHGTLSGTAPNVTYTRVENYNGPDSFSFKATDGTVDSASVTVWITVTAVNDAPVFTLMQAYARKPCVRWRESFFSNPKRFATVGFNKRIPGFRTNSNNSEQAIKDVGDNISATKN